MKRSLNPILGLIVTVLGAMAATTAQAAPPAGATIGNQASATYTDASQVTRTVTSNTVTTTVQQVASLTLGSSATRTAAIGGQVVFPHVITNTGNGTDSFNLAAAGTGTMSFASIQYFADANADGIPDGTTPITSTGQLAAGATFAFVAVGQVPASAAAGTSNTLTVTATSTTDGTVTASNTDTTTVTSQAIIQVSQSIDVASGPSPGGPRTISITYNNVGNAAASGLTLTSVLPAGFTYVANSGRWSVTGSGVVLTDGNAADNQGGIVYDYNISAAGRMTAVVASLAPGASATLTYQVNIAAGLPPGVTAATTSTVAYSYNDGAAAAGPFNSNAVRYAVAQNASVTLGNATVAAAPQGATVSFTNLLTNTGAGTDSFNLSFSGSTFPAGTTFQLFQPDGVTPMVDSTSDGIPDTGPVPAGGTYNVVVKATLPPGATGGPYQVNVTAASRVDASRNATATNTLTAISTGSVDLTADSAGSGAPGYGAGPEGSPVVTVSAAPGNVALFTLVVANGGSVADSFDLAASTDASFATLVLPPNATLVFRNAAGTVISNTGVINPGATVTVTAELTLAPTTATGSSSLYFRARSPSTAVADVLHATLAVSAVRSLAVTPNGSGQLIAGGTTVYTHTVRNNGNVVEGDGGAGSTVLLALASSAFSAVVYWDRNNDGILDASDPVIASLAELTGGTNGASTAAGLDPGEEATLFVKVTAPAGAAIGSSDTTTLTATTTGTVAGAAAPAAAMASMVSTVVASNVTLQKMQALDAACDGTADAAFSAAPITSGAVPGACVRYQVVATNAGSTAVTTLVISDATPAFTTYHATVAASASAGTVSAPADGMTGTVSATLTDLAAGASATLSFGVRIDP